ncbi:CBS domain-containing protein CBSX1 [Citrus sinensis]|uniref:CBS domain-containing protein CBSX1 n=1 Tax=Citrus sinensis TaxID=2711 RepID=A0ACB8J329_CITSI|nr:CBS domain-containing protein CBSX1 [Citrus sinensis]
MDSIVLPHSISVARLRAPAAGRTSGRTSFALQLPCLLLSRPGCRVFSVLATSSDRVSALRRSSAVFASGTLTANSAAPSSGVYTVGDFMTTKEELHVVKPTTTVDEALEILVEKRITGFPVIDDDWKLVGLVSDYDLLALDSISADELITACFPKLTALGKHSTRCRSCLVKPMGRWWVT